MPIPRALMLGSLSLDRLERNGKVHEAFGGAVCYSGLAAARSGLDVESVALLPADHHQALRQAHPQLRWHVYDAPRATRFSNVETDGQERKQRCTAMAPPLNAAQLPDGAWDWAHCGPLHPRDIDMAVLPALRRQAKTISLDVQGLLRHIHADGTVLLHAAAMPLDALDTWLHAADWIKASAREWAVLEELFGVAAEAACARWKLQGLLCTRGREGGTLYTPDGHYDWTPQPAVVHGLETGAGDAFLAAFMAHRLLNPSAGLSAALQAAASQTAQMIAERAG